MKNFLPLFIFILTSCGSDNSAPKPQIDSDLIFLEAIDNSGCPEIPSLLDLKKPLGVGLWESLDGHSLNIYFKVYKATEGAVLAYTRKQSSEGSYEIIESYEGVFDRNGFEFNSRCIFERKIK